MENDFAYEQLSPRAFEQLAVALAESVIGPGLEVYGPGPDGGREATWDGTIKWSSVDSLDDVDSWEGYTVVQVKHCQRPSHDPEKDLAWLVAHLKKELDQWMMNSRRSKFPNYLLIITNIQLTPGDPGGTMAKLEQHLDDALNRDYKNYDGKRRLGKNSLRERGLREIKVWHRNKLSNMLVLNASVRQRFSPLIALGDVLSRLENFSGESSHAQVASTFVDFTRSALTTGRWIRFDDAGDGLGKYEVDKMVVDLPVTSSAGPSSVLNECLIRGDQPVRASLWLPTRPDEAAAPRHLVVTGAPGNGKSTITRFLAHIYRAALLENEEENPRSLRAIITDAQDALVRLSINSLRVPRWPIRIELAAMADEMGADDSGPSIYKFISDQISARSQFAVQPQNLKLWLKTWPCVMLFDGLDEITHPGLRQRVVSEISQLVNDADDIDADLYIIVTTRPTGYTERLLPEHFDQIDLAYFSTEEAIAYGQHVTSQRLYNDEPDYRRAVLSTFLKSVAEPGVDRLLRTPLQVLIVTIIVENAGDLPANRYRLFWTYFDTVFKREAGKPTADRAFLNTYRTEIEDIHLRVGLILHQRCEGTNEIRARLPLSELREVAYARMREDHHPIPTSNNLADKLVKVATQRLVLLTADQDHTVSFDVRSLQELMAGRSLVNSSELDIRHNLRVTSRSPHWRNAWLFAAGEMFTGSNFERNVVLDVVETCDREDHWPEWLCPVGPGLAADILDDGLAANKPVYLKRLVNVGLRCLDGVMPTDPRGVARGLSAVATVVEHSELVADSFESAMNRRPMDRAVAETLLHYGALGSADGRASQYSDQDSNYRTSARTNVVRLGQRLRAILSKNVPGVTTPQLLNAIEECEKLRLNRHPDGELTPMVTIDERFDASRVIPALSDPVDGALFRACMENLSPYEWRGMSLLARSCEPTLCRAPVSANLRTSFASNH